MVVGLIIWFEEVASILFVSTAPITGAKSLLFTVYYQGYQKPLCMLELLFFIELIFHILSFSTFYLPFSSPVLS